MKKTSFLILLVALSVVAGCGKKKKEVAGVPDAAEIAKAAIQENAEKKESKNEVQQFVDTYLKESPVKTYEHLYMLFWNRRSMSKVFAEYSNFYFYQLAQLKSLDVESPDSKFRKKPYSLRLDFHLDNLLQYVDQIEKEKPVLGEPLKTMASKFKEPAVALKKVLEDFDYYITSKGYVEDDFAKLPTLMSDVTKHVETLAQIIDQYSPAYLQALLDFYQSHQMTGSYYVLKIELDQLGILTILYKYAKDKTIEDQSVIARLDEFVSDIGKLSEECRELEKKTENLDNNKRVYCSGGFPKLVGEVRGMKQDNYSLKTRRSFVNRYSGRIYEDLKSPL